MGWTREADILAALFDLVAAALGAKQPYPRPTTLTAQMVQAERTRARSRAAAAVVAQMTPWLADD